MLWDSGRGYGENISLESDLVHIFPPVNHLTLASASVASVPFIVSLSGCDGWPPMVPPSVKFYKSTFLTLNFYQSRLYNMKHSNTFEVQLAERSWWGSFVDKCHEVNVHCHNIDKEEDVLVVSFIQLNNKNRVSSAPWNTPHESLARIVFAVGTGKIQCERYPNHFNLNAITGRDPGIAPTGKHQTDTWTTHWLLVAPSFPDFA